MPKQVEWQALLDNERFLRASAEMGSSASGVGAAFGSALAVVRKLPAPIKLGAVAAAALAAALVKSLGEFRRFESELARVASTTGTDLARIATNYGASIQSISRATGLATTEIADAVQKAISGGVAGVREINALAAEGARFQAAGLGAATDAISATTTVFAQYKDAGIDTIDVMNLIARSAQLGEGAVADFSPAFKRLSGTAALLNIDLAELGAIITNISQTAPSVGEGVTQIEGLLKLLIRPSEQARKALEGVGLSVGGLRAQLEQEGFASVLETLNAAVESAGPLGAEVAARFFRDFQGLLGQQNLDPAAIRNLESQLREGADGAIDRAFDTIEETLDQRIARLSTNLETGWQQLGAIAADAFWIREGVDLATDLLGGVFDFVVERAAALGSDSAQAILDNVQLAARFDEIYDRAKQAVEEGNRDVLRVMRQNLDSARGRAQIRIDRAEEFRGDDLEVDPADQVAVESYREIIALLDQGIADLEQRNALLEDGARITAAELVSYGAIVESNAAIEESLRTQRERMDERIERQRALIRDLEEEAAGRGASLADSEEYRQALELAEQLETQRAEHVEALADRITSKMIEDAKRVADAEIRQAERAHAARLDLLATEADTALIRLEPTARRGTEAFFAQRRQQLEAEARAEERLLRESYAGEQDAIAREATFAGNQEDAERLRALYAANAAQLAADLDRLDALHANATRELARQSEEAAESAANAYADALTGVAQSIGDVFSRFEDSAEGWIELLLNGLPRIIEQFDRLSQASEGLFSGQGGGGAGGFLSLLGGLFGGFRAGGGEVAAGRAYIVGEGGPELFVPGRGGEIVAGGSGAVTVNMPVIDLSREIQQQVNALIPLAGTEIRRQLMEARLVGAGR